jgi:hypothetical protein
VLQRGVHHGPSSGCAAGVARLASQLPYLMLLVASLVRETLNSEVHEDAVTNAALPTAVRCLVLVIELMPVRRRDEWRF